MEAGLLASDDWAGMAVTLPDDPGRERQAALPMLRRPFGIAAAVIQARLYATGLGVFRISINGAAVTDDLLSPGWTAYRHRLLVEAYDVTDLVRTGANAIGAILGDGWYRGRLGWDPTDDRARYGKEVALLAQLEVTLDTGDVVTIATDREWRASTGEIESADLYDGSSIDLRLRRAGWDEPGFDDDGWPFVAPVPLDLDILEPRSAPPVRTVASLRTQVVRAGADRYRIDVGQNISGFLRLTVRGRRDQPVVVRHAEVLEPDGALHTRSLRSARATDTYILAEDSEATLEPAFTFHGFRYAEIVTEADIIDVEAVAISSDTSRRATFGCADVDLTRFHENVVWSQRDNFVALPTDCPQRDERLGWTGDAQAFAATACTLFDSQAFWVSWLRDLALDQDDVLGVPSVVPDVVLQGEPRFGRAGWADAATIVPWAVYEACGDLDVLRTQFDSMRRWVDSLVARRGSTISCLRRCSSVIGSTPRLLRTDRGRRRPTRRSSRTRSWPGVRG